jgi:hypothetical protein
LVEVGRPAHAGAVSSRNQCKVVPGKKNERPGGPRSPAPSPCCHSVAAKSGPLEGGPQEAKQSKLSFARSQFRARRSFWSITPRAWRRSAPQRLLQGPQRRRSAAGSWRTRRPQRARAGSRGAPSATPAGALSSSSARWPPSAGAAASLTMSLPQWAGGGAAGLGHAGSMGPSQRRSRRLLPAWPMSSIRNLSWPSQWRFQISAQIHPKFEMASQSVVIIKANPKM